MGHPWGTAGLLTCEGAPDVAAQLHYLADVTSALAAAIDDEAMVRQAARLVVPAVADWCAVHMAEGDSPDLRRVAVVHVDARKQAAAEQLLSPELHRPSPNHAANLALRSLTTQLVEGSGALAPDGPAEAIALYEDIGTASALTVPMVARGRPVGVLTLGLGISGRTYTADDIRLADELAHRCALAIDNARLYQEARRLLVETDNALALLDTLFAHAPIGLAFYDLDARYLKINEALADMNGLPASEHLGRTIEEVVPFLAPQKMPLLRRVVETGGPLIDVELAGETSADPGTKRAWLSSWFPVRNAEGTLVGVGIVVRDVTDRKQADTELARRATQQAAVATLGRQALTADIDELLGLAPRLVADALGVAHAAVLELQPGGDTVLVRSGHGCRPGVVGTLTIPVTAGTEAGYTLLSGGPVIVGDYSTEARFPTPPSLVEQGFVSGTSVVVRHRRGTWGILSAHSTVRRWFTAEDVHFLESMATIVGEAAGRNAAEGDLRQRATQQAAVAEFGRMAIVGTPVAELQHRALDALTTTLGVTHAAVIEQVGDGEGIIRAVQGWPAGTIGQVMAAGTGSQPGYTLLAGRPVVVEDLRTETRFRPAPLALEEGLVSSMSTVVRGVGRNIGVVSVHTRELRHFTDDDVYFLRSIANVLAAAIGRHEAEEELRQERERLRLALDAGRMGDWEWDIATNAVTWSESLERIFGLLPGGFGRTFDAYVELIHPDDRERTVEAIQRAVAERRQFSIEHRVRFADGSEHWIIGLGRVVLGDGVRPVRMVGVAGDITDRVEAERTRARLLAAEKEARSEAETARSRLEFLAEASAALSTSLNYRRTLTKVANLAVPRLADWCGVDIVEEARAPNQMAIAHSDPEKLALAQEMQRRYPVDPDRPGGVSSVIRTGTSRLIPRVTDAMLLDAAVDDDHLAMLQQLGLHSVMIVPLVARGRPIGAMTFVSAESQRVYDDDDLALAEDLARRAAAAIDNARLYHERSAVARALQRSLLPPEIPFIHGLEVADRYRPMSEQSEIGGDFYDVFESSDGSWCFVIGDVCGKGPEAAAVTGLARSTVRAVALHDPAPTRVLGLLNEALRRHDEEGRFCTVAFARVVPSPRGGPATATVSCGGHPLPLIVRRDGGVEAARCMGTLLGVFEDATLTSVDVTLRPGDSLVFYTDGVTEARRQGKVFGETRLAELLRTVAGSEPDTVADAIEDAVVTWQPEHRGDDLALLVIRAPA